LASNNCHAQTVGKSTPYKPEFRFTERYKESCNYSKTNSAFVQHLRDNGHSHGPKQEIVETLHFAKKGREILCLSWISKRQPNK